MSPPTRRAEALHEMRDPAGLKRRAVGHVGVERIVAGDRLAAPQTIARLRKPLPVAIVLRAVDVAVEAGQLRPVAPDLGDVFDDRHGDHRLRIARATVDDEVVAALTGRRARVADALEVPVLAAVVGVLLPVVSRRVVAAVAVQRCVQVLQLRRRRIRDAVDRRVDGAATRGDVNRHRHRTVLSMENGDSCDGCNTSAAHVRIDLEAIGFVPLSRNVTKLGSCFVTSFAWEGWRSTLKASRRDARVISCFETKLGHTLRARA